jgi:hypothetical protein
VPATIDLGDLPLVDGHCHPPLADPWQLTPGQLLDYLTEGRPGTMSAHVPHTGYYRRVLRELAGLFGCEPTVGAVLAERRARGPDVARRLLADQRVAVFLADTGYLADAMELAEMRRSLGPAVHEVLRIEACAQGLLGRRLGYEAYQEAFRRELASAAARCVALKTIIAYRSGLAIRAWRPAEVADAYGEAVARVAAGGSPRLTEKPLLDTLFGIAVEVCRESGRPLQVHSGFGDPDIDLLAANPLHLRPLLEDPRQADLRLVLLHCAYPYAREAAFMAAVWPQVYVDCSLVPLLLGSTSVAPLTELLALAPASKLLYGSDASRLPELYGLAARWTRAALGAALAGLVAAGDLDAGEARAVARRVLADNAVALYGLDRATATAAR